MLILPLIGLAQEEQEEEGEGEALGISNTQQESEASPPQEETPLVRVPQTSCQGRRIRRILVKGTRRVSEEDVLANIRLRAGRICTDAQISADARSLWDLGFFDHISIEGEVIGEEIEIAIHLTERPSIAKIRFEGNQGISTNDLQEALEIKEGSILSRTAIQKQVTKFRELYTEKGYFLARVQPRIEPLHEGEVNLIFSIEEGDKITVRRIRFVGNRVITSSELRGVMQTGESGLLSFLTNNDNFRRSRFNEDITRIQALYYDRGYLQIRVGNPRVELSPDRRSIEITIPINEGPRYRIGRLRVIERDQDGKEVEPLGGRRIVREMIAVNPGDWFVRTTLARGIQSIVRHYRDQGYAHVQVQPETHLRPEEHLVDITLAIERGPLVKIERIHIRGNTKTRDSVIRRELRIFEGDLYNQTLIEQSRAAVNALGYFERVEVSESEGSAPDLIVITFEVSERPTGTFQIGAGFSSIEAFIVTAQIQQQNLFGYGQSLALQLQLSGLRQLIQLQFVEPYFFNSDWSFAFDIFRTVRIFQAFNREDTGGSFSLGHWIGDRRFTFFFQYRADHIEIGPRTGGFLGPGTGQGLFQLPLLPIDNLYREGLTSSVRFTLSWDSRDNRITPTDGVFTQLSMEVADEWIGSVNSFVRYRFFTREYVRLWGTTPNEAIVLRFNTEAGLVSSRQGQGPPIFERFFLGGIFSVRGFLLNSLGPRVGIPSSYDPTLVPADAGTPVGGNMQFFYNAELEFPIVPQVGIRGVVFTDGGNAWNFDRYLCEAPQAPVQDPMADPCRFDPLHLYTSWGFGVRWNSPLGPLRFEWGIPFIRRPALQPQEVDFQFTIGQFF
ncbi:MAG: outer membrane protein assembly factor BamA [Sandaracinaceae bacterium]|nr:outer membrane protein assembly factor BamA [Sandaracinaceae bacterium]